MTENSYSQYYGKFRTKAPDIKVHAWSDTRNSGLMCLMFFLQDLMKEIETRAVKVSE